MTKDELIRFMNAAEARGDMQGAKAAMVQLQGMNEPQAQPPMSSGNFLFSGEQSDQLMDRVRRAQAGDGPTVEEAVKYALQPKPAPITPAGEQFSFGNTIGNIPGSAYKTQMGLREMITHPVNTAATMGKTLLGTGQLAWPGEQSYEKYPKAIVKHYKGILSNPGKALEEDPVGLGLDAYTLGRAGMGVAKNTARAVSGLLPESLPRKLYQRGAKFSGATEEVIKKNIDTALKEGLLYTEKGLEKLNSKLAGYDAKISKIIEDATQAGTRIDLAVVRKHIPELIRDVGGFKKNAPKDIAYIKREMGKFDDWMKGRKTVTPTELQAFKQDLYDRLFRDFAKQSPVTAIREKLDKNLARAAKEGIENAIPDQPIAELNRQYGDLLNLKEGLNRSTARVSNRDLFNLTDIAAVGMGSSIAGVPGGILAGLGNVLRHPVPSGRIAIGLHNLQNPTMGLLRLQPRDALLGLLQTGNIEEVIRQQASQ